MRWGKIGQAVLVFGWCGGAYLSLSSPAVAASSYISGPHESGQILGDAEFSDAARYGKPSYNDDLENYNGGGYNGGGYTGNSSSGNAFDDYNRGNNNGYQGGGYNGNFNSNSANNNRGNAFDDYNRGNNDGYQGGGYNSSTSNNRGNAFDDYNRGNNDGYKGNGYNGGYNSNNRGNAFDDYNRGNNDGYNGGYNSNGYNGGGYQGQGYDNNYSYNSNSSYPRIGDFLLYSQDTREAREAIKALQDERMSNFGRNVTMDSILAKYSHCVNGTKGFYYRPTTQVGTASVSFRCELRLTPQQTSFMQRGKMSQQLRYMLAEASLGVEYAELASKPETQRRANDIAALDNRTQRRFAWFDDTFHACMQPKSATVEFEFFRSPTNPKNFPNYRAGLVVNFADGVMGYSEFLGEDDGVEFDDLMVLYRNQDLLAAMNADNTKGLSLGIMLFKAYISSMNK